jgi:ABC-2 type transport system ATP-binding protein
VTAQGRRYRELHNPLHQVGALLEARGIHPGRSARNHLLCLAQANSIPIHRVDEVLDAVGLAKVANKKAGSFSLGMNQRLGIAGALLGDPEVLLLDEPVNGLDPEGIVWIRTLFRSLADEGRTVFVSSHLMSEMSLTADHVIVIGRGRLIADASMRDLLLRGASHVTVRSPDAALLATLVVDAGGRIEQERDHTLLVFDLTAEAVGELAASNAVVLHELTTEHASLEETFFELTNDSVDFHGDAVGTGGAR